jgi:phenylacetate-CoA ligase
MPFGLKMKPWITQNKVFRFINSKIPPRYRRHFSYYKSTRRLISRTKNKSVSSVHSFQLDQINKILAIGWQISGYKKYWETAGFQKKKLFSLSEISEIPVITKKYIKEQRDEFQPLDSPIRVTKTGGSTGTPFQVFEPIFQPRIELAFIHDSWSNYHPEVSLKTKATILRGTKIDGKWKHDPMKGLLLSTFQLSEETAHEFASLIDKYKTPILHAYPSSLYQFAKFLKENELNLSHTFSVICLGSEPLLTYQKKLIDEIFKAPVCHWYGQGEKVVFASSIPEKEGFHIYPQYGYTEILNERNEPVKEGEQGKIVGTSFWNTTVPLIRYNTSDLGIVKTYPKDPDSSFSFVLSEISGRSVDFLLTSEETLIPVTALNVTCAQFEEIKRVRFYQKTPGKADLLVELMPGINSFDFQKLTESLKELTQRKIDIDLTIKDHIPPTKSGKHIYLKQELDLSEYIRIEDS